MHFLVVFRLDGCCSQYLLLMIVDIDLDLWKYIDIDIKDMVEEHFRGSVGGKFTSICGSKILNSIV